ncbi:MULTISPECIES: hypothetical protein [Olivibacter]|uniref:Uncharacterized protein n=1 Tax=Olivibacter jilunii TaxID=985016 RepID=A0ABW6AZZ1_9SPHI
MNDLEPIRLDFLTNTPTFLSELERARNGTNDATRGMSAAVSAFNAQSSAAFASAAASAREYTQSLSGINTQNLSLAQGVAFVSRNIEQLEADLLTMYQDVKKVFDPAVIAQYNQRIRETQSEIARIRGIGVDNPSIASTTVQFNGLQNSINQITRELPAFTYSVQTGFMAISNNLPILFDQIARIRAENAALAAQGQASVPMWKQLTTSVFGWGTALSLAITLTTVYGKEIGNFIKSLFEGKKGLDASKESLNALNATLKDTDFKKATTGMAELKTNVDLAKKGLLSKTDVVKQYNEGVGKTIGQVKTLNEVEAKMIEKGDAYVKMMLYKAAATAALAEAGKSAMEQMVELNKTDEQSIDYLSSGLANSNDPKVQELYRRNAKRNREQAAKEFEERQKTYEQIAADFQKRAAETAKANGLDFFGGDSKVSASIVRQRQSLIDKITEIDKEYARKSMTSDEEELQALRDKFQKIREEVQRFNANPKNSKVKISLSGLDETQKNAESDLTYRQQTEKLKIEMDRQKDLFAQFEDYKKSVNLDSANARFKNDKAAYDRYSDYVQSEIDKVNNGASGRSLTDVEKKRIEELTKIRKGALSDEKKQRDDDYKTAYEAALSSEQKIAKIKADYAKKAADLGDPNNDELKRRRDEEIDAVNDEAAKKLEVFKRMYEDIDYLSSESAKQSIADAKKMLADLVASGKISKDLAKEIGRNLASATDKVDSRMPDGLRQVASELGNISSIVGEVDEGFGNVLGSVANIIGGVGDIQRSLIALRAAQQTTGIDKLLGLASGSLGIFGALSGGMMSIFNLFSSASQKREEQFRYSQEFQVKQNEAIIKVLDRQLDLINEIYGTERLTKYKEGLDEILRLEAQYRSELSGSYLLSGNKELDQYLTQLNTGQKTLKNFEDQAKSLRRQYEVSRENSPLLAQGYLNQATALESIIRQIGKTTQLTGQETIDELLALSGSFDEATQKALDNLVDLEQKNKDIIDNLKAEITGTSLQSLIDSARDAFANGGEDSGEAFAKAFNKVMEEYLLTRFSREFLEDKMKDWYDAFYDLSKDGLTDSEKEQLKKQWEQIQKKGSNYLDGLKDATGIDLTNNESSSTGLKSEIARASEQTVSELTGITRAAFDVNKRMSEDIKKGLDATLQIARNSAATAENTAQTVVELKNAVSELKEIKNNTKQTSNGYDRP